MRSTLEIIIAVKENTSVTYDELWFALLAFSGIEHFISQDRDDLIEVIDDTLNANKQLPFLRLKVELAKQSRERMFQAMKADPQVWLGPQNTPGNAEYEARIVFGKQLFKNATGRNL